MSNTLTRTLSGVVFLIIMTGAILLHPVIYAIVMLFAVIVMTHEYLKISCNSGNELVSLITITASITLFTTTFLYKWLGADSRILLLNLPAFSLLYIVSLYAKQKEGNQPEGTSLSGIVLYTALPFSLMNFLIFDGGDNYYPNILLSMFIILWSADVGAYVFGMTFGQKRGHKLFPSVSPKKSWEGFAGGISISVLSGAVISLCGLWKIGIAHSIIIAIIICIAGLFGDLAESLVKRKYGVKDSGSIMPGHGGLLDRFDGALIAFPLVLAYLVLFNLL